MVAGEAVRSRVAASLAKGFVFAGLPRIAASQVQGSPTGHARSV